MTKYVNKVLNLVNIPYLWMMLWWYGNIWDGISSENSNVLGCCFCIHAKKSFMSPIRNLYEFPWIPCILRNFSSFLGLNQAQFSTFTTSIEHTSTSIEAMIEQRFTSILIFCAECWFFLRNLTWKAVGEWINFYLINVFIERLIFFFQPTLSSVF